MNSRKLFFVLIGVIMAINTAGIGAIVFGEKLLQKKTTRLTELKVEANTIGRVQESVARAKKDIDANAGIEQIAKTVVPQEKDQARTVREIIKIAADSNIRIASVGFPSSTLGSKPGSTTAPKGGEQTANTQTQKVEGISNVERLEITVTSEPSQLVLYSDFLSFLERLEQNRRTAQVGNITVQPNGDNPNYITFSLVLNVYIKK